MRSRPRLVTTIRSVNLQATSCHNLIDRVRNLLFDSLPADIDAVVSIPKADLFPKRFRLLTKWTA